MTATQPATVKESHINLLKDIVKIANDYKKWINNMSDMLIKGGSNQSIIIGFMSQVGENVPKNVKGLEALRSAALGFIELDKEMIFNDDGTMDITKYQKSLLNFVEKNPKIWKDVKKENEN